jgi:hypothetical protein
MNIKILCTECINENEPGKEVYLHKVALTEAAIYQVTCSHGHTIEFSFSNLKCEILFESGIDAVNSGFYSAAIFNFAVALERFCEFAIYCLLLDGFSNHQDFEKKFEEFNKIWPAMSSQSERQFGGFLLLYLKTLQKAPPLFDDKFAKMHGLSFNLKGKGNNPVTLRNEVIHKGYYATYNQAVSYGEAVFQYCRVIVNSLHNSLKGAQSFHDGEFLMAQAIHFYRERIFPKEAKGRLITKVGQDTFLSVLSLPMRQREYDLISKKYSLFNRLPLQ